MSTTTTPLAMITTLEAELVTIKTELEKLQKEGNAIPGKAVNNRSLATMSETEILDLAKQMTSRSNVSLDWLEVNVDSDELFMGYPVTDWRKDINRRLKMIKFNARKNTLENLIAELEPILPEEVKIQRKMALIQAKMADLTPILKA